MKKIIGAIAVVALIIAVVMGLNGYTTTRNEGNTKELALTAVAKQMMIDYSQDRAAAIDQLGIAHDKAGAFDKILSDVMAGRNVSGKGTVDRSALISSVREAYPDLKGLDIFDRIMDTVQRMRDKFAVRQTQLAGEVQKFNTWRVTGGLFKPMWVSLCGFPSRQLELRTGTTTLYGQDALDKMSTVIMTADSQKIFRDSTDEQLDFGKKN
jgi:hypothetical protein